MKTFVLVLRHVLDADIFTREIQIGKMNLSEQITPFLQKILLACDHVEVEFHTQIRQQI